MTIVTVNGVRGYYVFRTWMMTKDGRKLYAKDYGKKAFRFFKEL